MDTCICIDEVVYKTQALQGSSMATRAISLSLGALCAYGVYRTISCKEFKSEKLTTEQKKTRAMRSHLSGNHPAVSGDDQCLSRKQAQLKSKTLATAVEAGQLDKRKPVSGTVTHF